MTAPAQPLTSAEVTEAIELWRRNIAQDPVLSETELERLDSLAGRIPIRTWPPVVLPPGTMPPAVTIPKASQQTMVCQYSDGSWSA